MFKRFISCLIVFSILWMDIASAMEAGDGSRAPTRARSITYSGGPLPDKKGDEVDSTDTLRKRSSTLVNATPPPPPGGDGSLKFPSHTGGPSSWSILGTDLADVSSLVPSGGVSINSSNPRRVVAFREEEPVEHRAVSQRDQALDSLFSLPFEAAEEEGDLDLAAPAAARAEKVPLLQGAADVEQGATHRTKRQILQEMFQGFLQENPALNRTLFDAWLTEGTKANADFLDTPCREVLLQLANAHPGLLDEDFIAHANGLVTQSTDLTTLTLRAWLDHYGIGQSDTPASGKKAALSSPEPSERKLCELLRSAVHRHIAYGVFEDQMEKHPHLEALFVYFDKVTLRRAFNCIQWPLGVFGLLVATVNALSQFEIFRGVMTSLYYQISRKWRKDYTWDDHIFFNVVVGTCLIAPITSFFDSVPRDWEWFTTFGESSDRAFIKRQQGRGAYFREALSALRPYAASLPAMTLEGWYAFKYVLAALKHPDSYFSSTGQIPINTSVGVLLALEAMALTVERAREMEDRLIHRFRFLQGWLGTTWLGHTRLAPYLIPPAPSADDHYRRGVLERFEEGKALIFGMEGEEVEDLYAQIHALLFKDNRHKTVGPLEGALTLAMIFDAVKKKGFSYASEGDAETPSPSPPSWSERYAVATSLVVTWLGASVGRYAAYFAVMTGFLKDFKDEDEDEHGNKLPLNTGDIWLASILAVISSMIEGELEQTAIEENMKGVDRKPPHAHSSHPWIQKALRGFSMLVGMYFVFSYFVLGLGALEEWKWPLLAQIAILAPFCMPEAHSNFWAVNKTFEAYPRAWSRIKKRCCGGRNPNHTRDEFILFLDRSMKLVKRADPEVLREMDKLLHRFIPAQHARNQHSIH